MAVNIALLTTAAPYIIDAANRILSIINKNKTEKQLQEQVLGHDEKLALIEKRQNVLLTINEDQSKLLKEMAVQNQKLVLALRNTRIIAVIGCFAAITAILLSILVN